MKNWIFIFAILAVGYVIGVKYPSLYARAGLP